MLARGGKPKKVKRPWTTAENNLIRRYYRRGQVAALVPLLPHRTIQTIRKQAQKVGVFVRRRWTRAEKNRFRAWWDDGRGIEWIARKSGRTPRQLYAMATKLKILGPPQGYETLTHATRRTGFGHVKQLRAVLRWAGVRVYRSRVFRRKYYKGLFATHFVDTFEVEEALAAWLKLEDIAYAARTRGIPHSTLYWWLLEAGAITPAQSNRGSRHHRIETAVIDRVVVARRRAAAELELGLAS